DRDETAGAQHPIDLPQRRVVFALILEHAGRDDDFERIVLEPDLLDIADRDARLARVPAIVEQLARLAHHAVRDVDAASVVPLVEQAQYQLAGSAADVENARPRRRVTPDHLFYIELALLERRIWAGRDVVGDVVLRGIAVIVCA